MNPSMINLVKGLIIGFLLSCCLVLNAQQNEPDDEFKQQLRRAIDDADQFEDKYAAQVWLTDMSSRLADRAPHIPENERLELLALVHKEATRNNLNPQVVLSLIQIESNFDRYALSKVGARGLMQVMPFWIVAIGKENDNLFDIAINLRYGCAILAIYMKREKKQIVTALARYHGSYPKDYYSRKVIKAWQSNWLYF
ncbi:MAG: soluble lytic murein transglycosylase-like protein [Enterobacterales bacterium]|jgi:soluble lytic murein transglycosylase-like protein